MTELELEKTYLPKALPPGLGACRSEVIRDAYVPSTTEHPNLRIRQRGDKYVITKKLRVEDDNNSKWDEHNITLTEAEFTELVAASKREFVKRRHYCEIKGTPAEVDIYLEQLAGLVLIDFEFDSEDTMAAFEPPDICLADVTDAEFLGGGKLAGKSYADIADLLEKYGYEPLFLEDVEA